jgi:CRISPR system Cascade subunit CasA
VPTCFSLLTSQWLPVRRLGGEIEWIAPAAITSGAADNPIVAFAWARPDFDLAAHELLIGLLAVVLPPRDDEDWEGRFLSPPSEAELATAFAPYEQAFWLDGERPRFLQDFETLEGEARPVEALLIDAPGENALKKNTDLIVKRGGAKILSRRAAAMALYTLQQFAPSGGAGHRTSLRGGGPLVTLAQPGAIEGAPPATLWQKLWLNTPEGESPAAKDLNKIFPWLTKTVTSAKGETLHESDSHPLHAFFGMPRRIRLQFEKNDAKAPCDLTGHVDDFIVTGFVTRPYGVNYGLWRHPLTPYYRVKQNAEALPVHAPEGRLGYRQWLGLVYRNVDETRLPAKIIIDACKRLKALEKDLDAPQWHGNPQLLAGGFAMDNMKPLAFAESEMPLHLAPDDLANAIGELASQFVAASRIVDQALGVALRIALFGENSKFSSDTTPLDAPRERLWDETEPAFHQRLDAAVEAAGDAAKREALKELWRGKLASTALRIFDDVAPLDDLDKINPKPVIAARKMLVVSLKGYGKLGRDLFKELALPAPEKKTGANSKNKKKEAAA